MGPVKAIPASSLRPAEPWHRDTRASELQLHIQAGKQTVQHKCSCKGDFSGWEGTVTDYFPPPRLFFFPFW